MFTLIQLRSVPVPPSLIYALVTPNDNRLYEGNIQYLPYYLVRVGSSLARFDLLGHTANRRPTRAEAAQEELT